MIYLDLFLTFLKIGAFTFGGGYAMLPLIQSEVIAKSWLSSSEIINFIAVSESTPGPFAVNISTYVGMETGGVFGAFCATFGVTLPSFLIIIIVAKFFAKFAENKFVKGCMSGLRPAVVGLIGAAVISIAKTVFFPIGLSLSVLTSYEFLTSALIFALSLFFILKFKKKSPIFVILIAACLGIAAGFLGERIL